MRKAQKMKRKKKKKETKHEYKAINSKRRKKER